jgi:hypothetical protein
MTHWEAKPQALYDRDGILHTPAKIHHVQYTKPHYVDHHSGLFSSSPTPNLATSCPFALCTIFGFSLWRLRLGLRHSLTLLCMISDTSLHRPSPSLIALHTYGIRLVVRYIIPAYSIYISSYTTLYHNPFLACITSIEI